MLKNLKKFIKAKLWRRRNPHNFTTLAGDNFPLDKVAVGKLTYGSIHAISYGGNSEFLKIGNCCSIADEVTFLLGGGHRLDRVSTFPFRGKLVGDVEAMTKGPIVLEDDVWIGYGATVLSGVTLGKGSVVGAGALVCRDVPSYAIVAGIPAKVIRYRFDDETRARLAAIDLGKVDAAFARKEIELLESPLDDGALELLEAKLGKKCGLGAV